jgi:hypothetical protein
LRITQKGEEVLRQGSIKVRVTRGGLAQQVTFRVRHKSFAGASYVELFTDRIIALTELENIANDIGLPVEAPNGEAFPAGTGRSDFTVMEE